MYLPDIELHESRTLDEASDFLSRFAPDVRALAGGTELLVNLKAGRERVGHIVSLNRIPELRGIRDDGTQLLIGALTTPNELAEFPIVRERFPALLDALCDFAAPQVRNMATVGGNIASAVPSADLPPICISMHGSVLVRSKAGERSLPLESFFLGPRRTVMDSGEVLTALQLPYPPDRFGAAYARFSLREANACAVAGVAASLRLDGAGRVAAARVVLGAVAPTPILVEDAAAGLVGRVVDDDSVQAAAHAAMVAAAPISDIRASGDYRRDLVAVLTQRAIRQAYRRTTGAMP